MYKLNILICPIKSIKVIQNCNNYSFTALDFCVELFIYSMDPKKYRLYESALIKSIRRGLTDDAIYWGSLLYRLNKADLVWRRLFIHLSEDIGLADRNLPGNIGALYDNYKRLSEPLISSFESSGANRLPFVHAIMLLTTAQKSRAVDNAVIVHFTTDIESREIPDYCYDFHSPLGRRMGRDVHHFLTVAGKIENESPGVHDQWKEKAFQILTKK